MKRIASLRRVSLFVIMVLVMFILGCSQKQPQTISSPAVVISTQPDSKSIEGHPAAPSESASDSSSSSAGAVEILVKAFRFGYDPNIITVKKGQTVKLNLQTIDVAHGLAIPDYGINLKVEPGFSQSGEFIVDKAGEFSMICSVPCGENHRSMRGTLIVEG